MKLWEKGIKTNELIEQFTIGLDRELDILLAPFDVLGSLAHITMLNKVGLLHDNDFWLLRVELINLYHKILQEGIIIEQGIEDIHSQVEFYLTEKLGEAGKRIHTARSRNDQVLLDIRLYIRNEIKEIVELTEHLFSNLQLLSEKNKDVLLPGYTHLQIAMPSSFGLWFGAYAESLVDDLQLLLSAYKLVNQNPLGSAAGYGSSFPINRQITTDLLGFDAMNYNVLYAQMSRGKIEKIVAFALASVASTLSKLAYDICLYSSQNFAFIELPDEFTTGSSIMPHKKNPDVFELVRAKCNKIQNIPTEINLISNNLPSGYFRDFQIIKESFLPAFDVIKSCISITAYVLPKIKIRKDILNDKKYDFIFSVEEVNKLVEEGMPFREAYQKIAMDIEKGKYNPKRKVYHKHEGSIHNLCNDKIAERMRNIIREFNFRKTEESIKHLLKDGEK